MLVVQTRLLSHQPQAYGLGASSYNDRIIQDKHPGSLSLSLITVKYPFLQQVQNPNRRMHSMDRGLWRQGAEGRGAAGGHLAAALWLQDRGWAVAELSRALASPPVTRQ